VKFTDSCEGMTKLNSHADTCCAGTNCKAIDYTGKTCTIIGFKRDGPNNGLFDILIVEVTTAYDEDFYPCYTTGNIPW